MVELYVKAAPGLRVPREDAPRRYITDDQPVSVPATAYYLRRLHSGELVSAPPDGRPAGRCDAGR